MVQVRTVAIQAPRLKESASGSSSTRAHPEAMTRCRADTRPSAIPTAHTRPSETAVAMPITSCGPKVPTARMFAPW